MENKKTIPQLIDQLILEAKIKVTKDEETSPEVKLLILGLVDTVATLANYVMEGTSLLEDCSCYLTDITFDQREIELKEDIRKFIEKVGD